MKAFMKKGIASTALVVAASAAHADCGEVTITEMNWASAAVVTAVSSFILEQGYGCSVTKVPSSSIPALTSIAETGAPDIATEIWVGSVSEIYPELLAKGTIEKAADVLSDGGIEGWFVPQYLVDTHPELATMEGVAANAELLGGRVHNCPEGWGCKISIGNQAKAFDLENNGFEIFIHGSGETLAASIGAAYESKEPWLGYYWAPTAILGKYPMVSVDMGPYDADVHACNLLEECATPGKSNFPVSEVVSVQTTDFVAREPAAAQLMRNVSFTNALMNGLLAWKEENNASAEETAVYFVSNHSDVWSGWLDDDARAKLSALIK